MALSPLATRAVLGLPAGELAALDVHADQVPGSFADRLRERLLAARGWPERFGTEIGLSPKAAARVIRFDRTRRELQRRIARTHRAPGLAGIAAEFGYYDQAHLAAEFGRLAGCPPSCWLAEEVRFGQAPAGPAEAGWPA